MTSFLELSCQSSLLVCYEKREPVMEEEEMVFEITLRGICLHWGHFDITIYCHDNLSLRKYFHNIGKALRIYQNIMKKRRVI